MAKSRFALGQVFGAVGAAANTVTTTFTAIDSTLEMASASIEQARYKQAIRHEVERIDYIEDITAESIMNSANRQKELDKLVTDGSITEKLISDRHAEIKAALQTKGLLPA